MRFTWKMKKGDSATGGLEAAYFNCRHCGSPSNSAPEDNKTNQLIRHVWGNPAQLIPAAEALWMVAGPLSQSVGKGVYR